MRRAPVALSLIVCLGGAACGPELPERLWRSEHVRYFTRADDGAVCPAILDEMEEHGQVIGGALGIEPPLVTYYRYPTGSDFQSNADCGAGASACARNAAVYSTDPFDRHELIHAYLAPYGLPPRLFMEGAAVALSCQHYPRPTGSWRDALTADRFSPQLYGAGGWLVSYLMRMFRKTWFVNLYGALQINANAEQIEKVFMEIYSMPLDAVWEAAIGGKQAPVVCPWECGRPAFAADGVAHALQPVCGIGSLQQTVDVPGEGVTRWMFDGDGYFSVGSCDGNDQPLHAVAGDAGGSGAMLAPLAAGKYFIDAVVHASGSSYLTVDTNAMPALSSFYCASAPGVAAGPSRYGNLTLFFPGNVGPQFTTFTSGTDQAATLTVASDDTSAKASMCQSCDTQTCTAVGVGGGLGTATPTGTVLSVPPGPAVTANIIWLPAP